MLAQVFGGKVQVFFSIEILRSLAAMRTQVSKVLGVNMFSWQNRTFYPIHILMQEMRVCRLTFPSLYAALPPAPRAHGWCMEGTMGLPAARGDLRVRGSPLKAYRPRESLS